MSFPTTRKHPRTLAEAFPADRAWCLEVHRRPWYARAARPLICLACCVWIGALLAQGCVPLN